MASGSSAESSILSELLSLSSVSPKQRADVLIENLYLETSSQKFGKVLIVATQDVAVYVTELSPTLMVRSDRVGSLEYVMYSGGRAPATLYVADFDSMFDEPFRSRLMWEVEVSSTSASSVGFACSHANGGPVTPRDVQSSDTAS